MSATFRWIVERRLLTLAGFAVILLGAFIPWPSLAVAVVVIVLGAVLLAVQIPIALRDATEQLDGTDETEEQSPAPVYPQYQPMPYQQPMSAQQQETLPQVVAPTQGWQPKNIPPLQEPAPHQQPTPSPQPAAPRPLDEPALPWRPQNIPQYRPEQ